MGAATPQRRRSQRYSSSRRSGEWASRRTFVSVRSVVHWGVVAIITGIAAVALVRHFARDEPVSDVLYNPFWRSDGVSALLASAGEAIDETALDAQQGEGGTAAQSPTDNQQVVSDARRAAADARRAVLLSPMNVTALALLATAEEKAGDTARADKLFKVALAHSKRMPAVLRQDLLRAVKALDVERAVTAIDLLLRPQLDLSKSGDLFKILTWLAGQPAGPAALTKALTRRPSWSEPFLVYAAQNGSIDGIVALLEEQPPEIATDAVWSALMIRMIKVGYGLQAYALWTSLAVPDNIDALPYVDDGSFEDNRRQLPFSWTIGRPRGVAISRDPSAGSPDGGNALRLLFVSPGTFHDVTQYLALAPNNYRLEGMVRLDGLKANRGLQWRVYCVPGSKPPIGQSPLFKGTEPWQSFDFTFTVPAGGCDTQLLRLEVPARIPAETEINGTAWFDAIRIQKQAGAQD